MAEPTAYVTTPDGEPQRLPVGQLGEAVRQGYDGPRVAFELTEDDIRSIEQATGATRAEVLAVVA